MSATVPPMPTETSTGLSELQRITNTFISPSKTLEDIRRNASWWVPWLIIGVFAGVAFVMFTRKIDVEQFVREQIANSSRAQAFESLSKEQQEQQIAITVKITKITPYLLPVYTLIGGLIAAAVLMAAFNFIH